MSSQLLRSGARWLIVAFGMSVLWTLAAAEASAQGSTGNESVAGAVINQFQGSDGKRVREPVEGVKITVSTPSGEVVGEAVTGADGTYAINLPGPGEYVLSLDEASLPDGVTTTDQTRVERSISVNPNGQQVGTFFLGKDLRKIEGRWSLLPQALVNGLVLSFIIGVCAVGLSLIYGTTGLSNFSHGEIVTLGALVAWVANQRWGLHLLLAAPFGIAAAALAGIALERGLWRNLRARSTSLTAMMIVSIGIGLGVRYLYQFLFGARSKPYRQYSTQRSSTSGRSRSRRGPWASSWCRWRCSWPLASFSSGPASAKPSGLCRTIRTSPPPPE